MTQKTQQRKRSQPAPLGSNLNLRTSLLIGAAIFLCIGIWGVALWGLTANAATSPEQTGEARQTTVEDNICRRVIESALRTADKACANIGPNKVCYGNSNLVADIMPGITNPFAVRGDVLDVFALRRLKASEYNPANNEWGIAIFKLAGNLPRTVPGENATLIVFGNTSLGNTAGNLQAFTFANGAGRVNCDNLPENGLLLRLPEGVGIRLMVNGAELTIAGTALLQAQINKSFDIAMLKGSAVITSGGVSETISSGQQVGIPLNNTEASGPPSLPSLSAINLPALLCVTLNNCDQKISTLSPQQAAQAIAAVGGNLTSTLTLAPTQVSPPLTASATTTPTPQTTPSPSATTTRTPSPTNGPTPTRGPSPTPTETATPSVTPSPTLTLTASVSPTSSHTPTTSPSLTPSRTPTFTITPSPTNFVFFFPFFPTNTFTPSPTPTLTLVPSLTPTATATQTNTPSATPTATSTNTPTHTATSTPACTLTVGALTLNGSELILSLTNNSTATLAITQVQVTASDLDRIIFGQATIWNGHHVAAPSIINNGFAGNRQLLAGATKELKMRFSVTPPSNGNSVNITFDLAGCVASQTN